MYHLPHILDVFLQPFSNHVSSCYEMAGRIIAFDPFSSPALSMRSISARISLRFSRSDFASSYLRRALASCTKLSRRASCSNNGWSVCARAASRSATSLASGIEVLFLEGDAVAEGLGRDYCATFVITFVLWYVRSVCIIYVSGFQFDIPLFSSCDFTSIVRVPSLQCMYDSSLERWGLGVGIAEVSERHMVLRRVVSIHVSRTYLEWEQIALQEQVCTVEYRCLNSILGRTRYTS